MNNRVIFIYGKRGEIFYLTSIRLSTGLKLLSAAISIFIAVFTLWRPVEAFIYLMVAKGQILYTGAIAVKSGLAIVILLFLHTLLNRQYVEETIKPFVRRNPVSPLYFFAIAIIMILISSIAMAYLRAVMGAININDANIESYQPNLIQQTVTLLFYLCLMLLLYFKFLRPPRGFSSLDLRHFINQPYIAVFFVYGLMLQVIAATCRDMMIEYPLWSYMIYAFIFCWSTFQVSVYSRNHTSARIALLNLPGVLVESLGGSNISLLGNYADYPRGIIILMIVIPVANIVGTFISRSRGHKSI